MFLELYSWDLAQTVLWKLPSVGVNGRSDFFFFKILETYYCSRKFLNRLRKQIIH